MLDRIKDYGVLILTVLLIAVSGAYAIHVYMLRADIRVLESEKKSLEDSVTLQNESIRLLQSASTRKSAEAEAAVAKADETGKKLRQTAAELAKQKSTGNFVDDCKAFEANLNKELE